MTEEFTPDPVIHGDDKRKFIEDQYTPLGKQVYIKAGEDMSDKGYEEAYFADVIRTKMKRDNKRFWAGDNISDYLHEGDKEKLIDEATEAFELVLDHIDLP